MTRIFVPRDALSLALGADAVAAAIRQACPEAVIVRNGSRGMAWLEPLVEVETPDGRIGYGPVSPVDVESLVASGFLTGGDHELRVGPPGQLPFLHRQTRITFARNGVTDPTSLSDYRAHGGLAGLTRALSLGPAGIVDEVTQVRVARPRRRGDSRPASSGAPSCRRRPGRNTWVCNADEGDSGTFADRMVMEGDPFLLIEGMIIAGIAAGADRGYVYLRSEYPNAIAIMNEAIRAALAEGVLGARVLGSGHAFHLEVRVGAGAYVCGEETSLLDSLEGKRGQVRAKPPLPALAGLFGKPTIVNNVLSLAAVPDILGGGAEAYQALGFGRSRGTMPIQLAGNIARGGLFEVPFGITLGGAGDGHRRRHGNRAAGARGPGRRPARRLFPARVVRHAVRLRGPLPPVTA